MACGLYRLVDGSNVLGVLQQERHKFLQNGYVLL